MEQLAREVWDSWQILGRPGISAMFILFFVAELPRYGVLAALAVLVRPWVSRPARPKGIVPPPRWSAVIAGHNEEAQLRRCIAALHEQSLPPSEIIVVNDGSTDRSRQILQDLQAQGQITGFHSVDLRGGKAAALNLALRFVQMPFLIILDADTTFDRDAAAQALRYFVDPRVGAVGGNLTPRNARQSLVSAVQSIEYLIAITLGRLVWDMLRQISIVSGAFGAFRVQALHDIGGLDAGSGEDLDLTLRMRTRGWAVRFAADANCRTTVPHRLSALIRQRLRWERDAFHLRLRRVPALQSPSSRRFRRAELLHQADFVLFHLLANLASVLFWFWLALQGNQESLVVALTVLGVYLAFDALAVLLGVVAARQECTIGLLWYLPAYTLFNMFGMRLLRSHAYLSEWLWSASASDDFVPRKVHRQVGERE